MSNEDNKNDVNLTSQEKFNEITKYLKSYDHVITKDDNYTDELINKLYDLLINNIIDDEYKSAIYISMIGTYYYIKNNGKLSKEYFLKAIELGDIDAMNNLADYYLTKSKYDEAIKYYNMSIDKGSVIGMNSLAYYYESISDEENMLKYYNMAIDKGYGLAMHNLAAYYEEKYNELMNDNDSYDTDEDEEINDDENDIDNEIVNNTDENIDNDENEDDEEEKKKEEYKEKMLKLYLMAISNGETSAMMNLAYYYQEQNNFDEMIKYFEMVISKGVDTDDYNDAIKELAEHYKENEDYDNTIKYLKMITDEDQTEEIKEVIKRVKYDELEPLCEKYNLNISEFIQDKIQFMKNKIKFKKEDDCLICLEHKDLIPYDCFGHYFCDKCYYKMDKCPICNIEKHQMMI